MDHSASGQLKNCPVLGCVSPTMNFFRSSTIWSANIILLILSARSESWKNEVLEKFYWTPNGGEENVQWEFLIIGKSVPWGIARVSCALGDTRRSEIDESINESFELDDFWTSRQKAGNIDGEGRLAILESDDAMLWLSKMLAESNYRYDGLWIGGRRKDEKSNWTWIENAADETPINSSSILVNYPEWYKTGSEEEWKNCLIFDRTGHNLPLLVPTDCQKRKPFVCAQIAQKKIPDSIVEGIGVNVDGLHYTIYGVRGEDDVNSDKLPGIRRLNGGGVKWIDARIECRKRGKYLAMVMSNEAAKEIASIMLKNRPSMESAWLGGWSSDGVDWTWSTSGVGLSSRKSPKTGYPPWLKDHPIVSTKTDFHYQKHGRCLILDRHLCPDHISPVFLDLDCDKKRPFVCQNEIPNRRFSMINGSFFLLAKRIIRVDNQTLEFSIDRMTWNEGEAYCARNNGKVASILNSKTLSMVLDQMAELHLDHVWVGGKTSKTNEGWRWMDETGGRLTREGIGYRASWCLGDDEAAFPKAEANSCLNLDREGHGLPLFYGLPCDSTRQHVLCSLGTDSRSANELENSLVKREDKGDAGNTNEAKNIGSEIRKNLNDTLAVNGRQEDGHFGTAELLNSAEKSLNIEHKTIRALKENDMEKDTKNKAVSTVGEKNGTRFGDLDDETKKMLIASGYNLTDSDMILGLELQVVDSADNSTTTVGTKEYSRSINKI